MSDKATAMGIGLVLGVMLVMAGMTFAPDTFKHPRLSCGMATLDGCAVWVDKQRIERFEKAQAGS